MHQLTHIACLNLCMHHPRRRSQGQALLESMPCLDSCISEALRLTAHTIGGIRKVVAPNGFTFPVHAEGTFKAILGNERLLCFEANTIDFRRFR